MLRRPRGLGLVVVLAVVLCGTFALAQPEGGGRGGRGGRGGFGRSGFGMAGPMMGGMGMGGLVPLAAAPPVQKELDLDPEAVEKVQKLAQEFPQEMMGEMEKAGLGFGSFQQLQELSEKERPAKLREMNEKRNEVAKKLNEKFVPKLKEAISAKQFERLQQIHWQAAGSQALASDADLVKALDLKKEQREKISKINEEFDEKMPNPFAGFGRGGRGGAGGPPDFQAIAKQRQELTKERDAKATEVLDEEQQQTYAKLKGKPFEELAQLQAGPGMGMGRGGFGGRGGPGGFGGGRGGRGGFGRGPDPEGRPKKKAIQGEEKDEGEKKD